MLRTFNCGIGMIAVVAAGEADAVTAVLTRDGETRRAARRGGAGEATASASPAADGSISHGDGHGPQARRHPDLRPRLQHGGADRGREGPGLSGARSRSSSRTGPMPPACARAQKPGIETAVVDHTHVRQGPRGVRARAASRARSAPHRSRLPRRLHAAVDAVVRHALDRPHAQHPSCAAARRSRASTPTAARSKPARRATARPCISSCRKWIPARSCAGFGAGAAPATRRGDAGRARARGRAPHLSARAAHAGRKADAALTAVDRAQ